MNKAQTRAPWEGLILAIDFKTIFFFLTTVSFLALQASVEISSYITQFLYHYGAQDYFYTVDYKLGCIGFLIHRLALNKSYEIHGLQNVFSLGVQ